MTKAAAPTAADRAHAGRSALIGRSRAVTAAHHGSRTSCHAVRARFDRAADRTRSASTCRSAASSGCWPRSAIRETRLPPVIHVAGTNGKGSTIAFLRAMLEAAGQARPRLYLAASGALPRAHPARRAGRRTSRRRRRAGRRARRAARAPMRRSRSPSSRSPPRPPSCSSPSTRPTCCCSKSASAAASTRPTSSSGRALTVITPVSIDHPEFLGDTLAKIAAEKAGIFKRGVPAIIGAQQDATPCAVLERAGRRSRRAADSSAARISTAREEHGRLVYRGRARPARPAAAASRRPPSDRNAGDRDRRAARRRARRSRARPSRRAWRGSNGRRGCSGSRNGRWSRRCAAGAEIWLDGGHNADGGRALRAGDGRFEEKSPRPLVILMHAARSQQSRRGRSCARSKGSLRK